MESSDALASARRNLGRQLAALRKAAGISSQHGLAKLIFFDRSTIAMAETGRTCPSRLFWQRCDAALDTGGVLTARYNEIATAAAQRRREAAMAAGAASRRGAAAATVEPATGAGRAVTWEANLRRSVDITADEWEADPVVEPLDYPNGLEEKEFAFAWLVATDDAGRDDGSGSAVFDVDVRRLAALRRTLKAADNAHGGTTAWRMAVSCLRHEVAPTLRSRGHDPRAQDVLAAVAVIGLDVGWMAYDSGRHGVAARYFGRALRLAHGAGDRLLGGRVLCAMSHQALHLGNVRIAVDLVRAAQSGTREVATGRARAMFAAMEAMALAAAREAGDAGAALARAERELDRTSSAGEEPEWLDFDEGGWEGHAARAYRYLDDGAACVRHAENAAARCRQGHGRTRAQRLAILAAGQLIAGQPDRAAASVSEVVDAAWLMSSRHVDEEIADLAGCIRRVGSRSVECLSLVDKAEDYLARRAPDLAVSC